MKYANATIRGVAKKQKGFTYEKDELLWKYDNNGKRTLEKVGTIDTYLATQADAEQCNVANILRRATLGEEALLNKVNGLYADTTMLPKTLMEAQNFTMRAEKTFNELPKEIREEFGNDLNKFMTSYGTKDFEKKINKALKIETKETINTKTETKEEK